MGYFDLWRIGCRNHSYVAAPYLIRGGGWALPAWIYSNKKVSDRQLSQLHALLTAQARSRKVLTRAIYCIAKRVKKSTQRSVLLTSAYFLICTPEYRNGTKIGGNANAGMLIFSEFTERKIDKHFFPLLQEISDFSKFCRKRCGFRKKIIFCLHLEGHWQKSRIRSRSRIR